MVLQRAFVVVMFIALSAATAHAAPTWPSVATELPKAGGGDNDVAVVVGISDYFALPDIAGAADNARDWSQYLLRVRGLPRSRLTLLTDGEATKERIERALTAATTTTNATTKKGRLWFIFVGHGAPALTGRDGLLLGADTQPDADSLAARGLSQAHVDELVKKSGFVDAVVVYDACFSGNTSDGTAPLVPGLQATIPLRKAATQATAATTQTIVLASSESFAGPLPGEKRPAYSYLLLGGMRGWADDNNDGVVSVDEAHGFATDTLRAALKQSSRLPVRRGATSTTTALSTKAAEAAPDVTALLLRRCPDGTQWAGRSCAVVACPRGTSFNGTSCAATTTTVTCPTGSTWNGGSCAAASVSCPAGTTWDNAACRAPAAASMPAPTSAPTSPPVVWRFEALLARGLVRPAADGLVLDVNTFFAAGQTQVRRESVPVFAELVSGLSDEDGFVGAVIVCHSDLAGSAEEAQQMTQRRAQSIVDTAIGLGVDAEQLFAIGVGFEQPVADNATAAGRVANRRCEVKIR